MQKKEFGEKLLALRKAKKASQAEVAEYIGLTVAAYQNYENGRREAGYETISNLADFYGVTTDYLLGREETKPDPFASLNLSAQERAIVETYIDLNPKDRTEFVRIVKQIVQGATVKIVVEKPPAPEPQKTFMVRTAARSDNNEPIRDVEMTEEEFDSIFGGEPVPEDL